MTTFFAAATARTIASHHHPHPHPSLISHTQDGRSDGDGGVSSDGGGEKYHGRRARRREREREQRWGSWRTIVGVVGILFLFLFAEEVGAVGLY
jgi:hypothetical protein